MKFPTSKRARRVGGEIQKIVAERIRDLVAMHYPGVLVTIPEVRVSDDLSMAAIYASVHGIDDKEQVQRLIQKEIKRLRSEAASLLRIRKIPEFRFVWDDTMERADRIEQLLNRIHNSSSSTSEGTGGAE